MVSRVDELRAKFLRYRPRAHTRFRQDLAELLEAARQEGRAECIGQGAGDDAYILVLEEKVAQARAEGIAQGREKERRNRSCQVGGCTNPITCFGQYESAERPDFGCDEHCGHGCEDGWCKPIATPAQSEAAKHTCDDDCTSPRCPAKHHPPAGEVCVTCEIMCFCGRERCQDEDGCPACPDCAKGGV